MKRRFIVVGLVSLVLAGAGALWARQRERGYP